MPFATRSPSILRATGADDPEILAELLFATIDGVAEHYALDPEHYPLDQVVERFVSLYIGPTPGSGPERKGIVT